MYAEKNDERKKKLENYVSIDRMQKRVKEGNKNSARV
jgi:hypothetical protein